MSSTASHPNAVLIGRFYDALGRRDASEMVACYAPDATFSDPVFPELDAAGVHLEPHRNRAVPGSDQVPDSI